MKNKREEFIDFGLWLFNNSHRALTIGQFVDEYLSINSSQIDVETLGSNEKSKEFCSHEFVPKKCWVHKCVKCGELHVEYKND